MTLSKVVREAERRHLIALYNAEGNPYHGEHGWFSGADSAGALGESIDKKIAGIKQKDEWRYKVRTKLSEPLTSSEQAYVRTYTEQGYQDINSTLRSSTVDENGFLYGGANKYGAVDPLDSAIAKSTLVSDTAVTRSVSAAAFPGGPDSLKPGTVISDRAYMSTSALVPDRTGTGIGANSKASVLMHLFVPKGSKGLYVGGKTGLSQFGSQEEEIIFPRNQRVVVSSVERQGDRWIVKGAVIP